jgi:hypothetical protein
MEAYLRASIESFNGAAALEQGLNSVMLVADGDPKSTICGAEVNFGSCRIVLMFQFSGGTTSCSCTTYR